MSTLLQSIASRLGALLSFSQKAASLSIIWRDNADPKVYEEARLRRIFNTRKLKRYPLAVVFVRSESDIVDAVKLARDKNCSVAVRAGGRSWPAWSVRDDAIVIDMGNYSELVFDEETGIVRTSPSITARHLDDFLLPKGRTFAAGHCPDVGIGGFLLGGGMGWNCNNWGWSCEKVVAVDVVTPSGDLIRADAHQNTDLFWAARGAGPGFPGVVTRFHLQTRPTPKIMRSSGYVYPLSHYKTAFNWALKLSPGDDDGIEIVAIGSYPAGMDQPCITMILLAYGDGENEESITKFLRQVDESRPAGAASRWFCEETNLQKEFDNKGASYPENHRYCVDNAFLSNDADVAAVLEPAYTTLVSRKSLALWSSMKPCSRRKLPDMALSMQSDHYFAVFAIYEDEIDDTRCRSWVNDLFKEIGKHSVGAYLGEFDFQARQSKFWGDEERNKIEDIRQKWDPDGRICGYLGLDITNDDGTDK